MKVGIVLNNDFPDMTEVRPRKIAKKLHSMGDECVIYARDINDNTDQDYIGYAIIRRFSLLSRTRLGSLLISEVPFNPFWILWLILRFYIDDPDIIIGSDIRAGFPGLVAARILRIPAILDLQENNTERQKLLPIQSPAHYITRNHRIIYLLEMACIWLANEVWVVVEERKQALICEGISPSKLTVVSNTPFLSEYKTLQTNEETDTEFDWPGFTLLYIGILNRFRGLELAIAAIPLVRKAGHNVHLVIAGTGDHLPELKQKTAELGVEEFVHFPGRVDPQLLLVFLQSGDVGLIMNDVNPAHNTTIPNKLFDYMMAELPVLVTNLDPVSRIVHDVNCGYVLPPETTPKQVAESIIALKTSDKLDKMGKNGFQAIQDRYNWDQEWEQIEKSFERLI